MFFFGGQDQIEDEGSAPGAAASTRTRPGKVATPAAAPCRAAPVDSVAEVARAAAAVIDTSSSDNNVLLSTESPPKMFCGYEMLGTIGDPFTGK